MDAYEQAMYGAMPSYQLTEEEKKALKMQQLIATGAALMAGRGNFVNNLGQAMLVGQNQGSEGMQDLRRNKLADAEIQYRNAQIANQQRTFEAAKAKALADQQAAAQQANLVNGVQEALRQGAAGQMPFGSFTNDPAASRQVEQMTPEQRQRAAYLQAATMAIGNEKVHGQTLGTVKEFLTQYGLDPKPNAQGQLVAYNQWGEGKPTGQNAAPDLSWRTMGNRDEAWNKYDTTKPFITTMQGRSPDNVATVGETAAGRIQRKEQWENELVDTVDKDGNPIKVKRKDLPPQGVMAAPKGRASTDRSSANYGRVFDDAAKAYDKKWPTEFGIRPKDAPEFESFVADFVRRNGKMYGVDPNAAPPSDAAVTKPTSDTKPILTKAEIDERDAAASAIKRGAPRDAVRERAKKNGFDPDKLGI